MPSKPLTNDNGLTLDEWQAAATQGGKWDMEAVMFYGTIARALSELRSAWEHGEDPTEWAAAFEHMSR